MCVVRRQLLPNNCQQLMKSLPIVRTEMSLSCINIVDVLLLLAIRQRITSSSSLTSFHRVFPRGFQCMLQHRTNVSFSHVPTQNRACYRASFPISFPTEANKHKSLCTCSHTDAHIVKLSPSMKHANPTKLCLCHQLPRR